MTTWSELILARLVDFYVLSAVLLLFSWIAMRWLLRNPAQRMIWSWGVTVALLMIAAASFVPNLRQTPSQWLAQTQEWLRPEPPVAAPIAVTPSLNKAPIIPPLAAAELESLPVVRIADPVPAAQPSLVWSAVRISLITAWCSAAVLTGCWLVIGAWRVRRIKRRVEAVPSWAHAELAKAARGKSAPLFASQQVQTAVALGALRPTILLPAAEVHDDNQPAVRASIRHEWAHIAHGDLWLHALQRLLTILLFAHPLYWLFRKQTRADQELLADAAASGGDPLGYAETLLTWARQAAQRTSKHRFSTAESLGLTMWRDASSLQRRIEMLVEQKSSAYVQPGRFTRTAVVALLLLIGAALSTITVQSQEQGRETETAITNLASQNSGHSYVVTGKDQGGKRQVVITQTPDRLVIQVREAVLGPDLETTYAAKDAATLQKRHPEIFRLYERFSAAASEQAARNLRDTEFLRTTATMNKKPVVLKATSEESGPILLVDSTIGEISHAAFADTEVGLDEIFETKLAGKCELQGNLIIALCTPAEAEQIKASLNEAKALTILSLPKIVTHNGQPASIRVGSAVPIVTAPATVDDQPEGATKFRFEGIALDVSPSIVFEDKPTTLGIEVKAEYSKRDPVAGAAAPASRREMKFKATFEPGQILVVAERQPKDKVKDKSGQTLFLLLNVRQATAEAMNAVQAEPVKGNVVEAPLLPSPDFERRNLTKYAHDANPLASPAVQALREENAALKAENQQFRAMHVEMIQRMEKERREQHLLRDQQLRSESSLKLPPPIDQSPDQEILPPIPENPEHSVRVYGLKHIPVDKAKDQVTDLLTENKQQLKVSVDERTNSLILVGNDVAHQIAAALLKRLDEKPPASNGNELPPKASNNRPVTVAMPPATEIQRQLYELEILEAEAVLSTTKNKLERLQQMHKNGQVSSSELMAAELEAKTAMVQMELAKRPNDPRFQAEASMQIAEAKLQAAKTEFERASQQGKAGVVSAEEVAKLELNFRRAEIAVRRAKLQLHALPKELPTPRGR